MSEDRKHTPFVCFSTRASMAASQMLEAIGALTALHQLRDEREMPHRHEAYHLADLRKAIEAAGSALSRYDALTAAGRTLISSAEFESARSTPEASE